MRVYLDHNATTPLRAEARLAMYAAMEVAGNPSSIHAEGRAAKGLIERARAQIATSMGAEGADIIFTSGATEAAGLGMSGRDLKGAAVEHGAVLALCDESLGVDSQGCVAVKAPERSTLQWANSETGIIQHLPDGLALSDMTQGFGKLLTDFNGSGVQMALISAHKLGGPKGVGALVLRRGQEVPAQIKGGGQEMGRRSGTENTVGIAGFGAAAESAARDVASGRWEEVAELRDLMESTLEDASKLTILVGKETKRLSNTSCILTPGWKGETQVMQMDLAGFAISAGSACSSGKVRASAVLRAMGCRETDAGCAIRVSLGLETTREDVLRFAQAWTAKLKIHEARAA